jgi:hypothetical protein
VEIGHSPMTEQTKAVAKVLMPLEVLMEKDN